METVKINDNINLNYISMTKLKTTSIGVYIHRPLCKEEVSHNALLPLVLKSATKELPSREKIAAALDDLYGATMGSATIKMGEDHVIYFDAETISDRFAPNGEKLVTRLLGLLMSVVFEPKVSDDAFDDTIVTQERQNAMDKIDAFVNDKRSYASSRCQQETARGTNYEILRFGDKETLKKITASDLYSHYKNIINSSVIDIYICGDADLKAAEETVRKYILGMNFKAAEICKTEILSRKITEINNVVEKMDVAQGKLAMGFLTNTKSTSKESAALAVFNSLFGAGAHSKLFNNVREKLSLAYYASSQLEKLKGLIIVNAGIEFENFQKAYNEVLVQLDEIRKGHITEHEFSSSVKTVVNTYKSYYDDQRAFAIFCVSQNVAGTNMTVGEFIKKIEAVTVDDVIDVAKKLQLDTVYFLAGKESVN